MIIGVKGMLSVTVVASFLTGAFVASPELRAYAANTVGSIDIIDNSIQSVDIKDGEVKTPDLANNAVTSLKIADNAVGATEIKPNAIGTLKISDNAVGASEIAANAVGTSEIANGAITSSDLSSSFIYKKILRDEPAGNALGWDPDGSDQYFSISDPQVSEQTSNIIITLSTNMYAAVCTAVAIHEEGFEMACIQQTELGLDITMPSDGATLHYTVINTTNVVTIG